MSKITHLANIVVDMLLMFLSPGEAIMVLSQARQKVEHPERS